MSAVTLAVVLTLCTALTVHCQNVTTGQICVGDLGDTDLANGTRHCAYESGRTELPPEERISQDEEPDKSENHTLSFDQALSQGLLSCVSFDLKKENVNENTGKVIFCLMFALDRKQPFEDCIEDIGADLKDPVLNQAILINPGVICNKTTNTSKLPYLCAYRYASHDRTAGSLAVARHVCILPDDLRTSQQSQAKLREIAKTECTVDLEAGHWVLSQVPSMDECRAPKLFYTNARISASDNIMNKVIWVISGLTIVADVASAVMFSFGAASQSKVSLLYRWVAISDILSVLGGIIPSIVIYVNPLALDTTSAVFCVMGRLITYYGNTMSSLIHVQMTINRCVCVMFPLKANVWANVKKTVKGIRILLILSAVGTILYVVPGLIAHRRIGYCKMFFGTESGMELVSHWIYYVLFLLAPLTIIIVLTVGIVRSLIIQARKRKQMMTNTGSNKNLRVTINLLLTVLLYVLIQFPNYILDTLSKMNPSSIMKAFSQISLPLTFVRISSGVALLILWICMNADIRKSLMRFLCKKNLMVSRKPEIEP